MEKKVKDLKVGTRRNVNEGTGRGGMGREGKGREGKGGEGRGEEGMEGKRGGGKRRGKGHLHGRDCFEGLAHGTRCYLPSIPVPTVLRKGRKDGREEKRDEKEGKGGKEKEGRSRVRKRKQ